MSNSILSWKAFSIDFGVRVYHGRDFSLNRGEVAHLFAPSAFNAQDFFYLVAGLHNSRGLTIPAVEHSLDRTSILYDQQTLGFILLKDKPIYEYTPRERAQYVEMIYENPEIAIIGNTVVEEFWYSYASLSRGEILPSVLKLDRYGLYQKRNRLSEVLSGGERHRLNCACALEHEPKLLIGDFSSSNLDKDFLRDFLFWIDTFTKQGNALLLTGLSLDELGVFDSYKSLVVVDGRIEEGTPNARMFKTKKEESDELKTLLLPRKRGDKKIVSVHNVGIPGRTQPISFEIAENEILIEDEVLIIEGPNGSGKTTLGHILAGRIKRREYRGEYTFAFGVAPVECLQHPERSFTWLTVYDELPNIELLQICGITQEQHFHHPRSISRAQQKLLSIAVTLLYSKKFAILDEPTCGMDYEAKLRFIQLLNYFKDMAVLIFTHDEAIRSLGRRIHFQPTPPV